MSTTADLHAACLTALEQAKAVLAERLFARVIVTESQCWEWQGSKTAGYGYISVNGKNKRTHRVAYELLVGPIPTGLFLDHLCRNRSCCNPDHLESVDCAENNRRGLAPLSKRNKDTCRNGLHPWPESSALTYDGKPGCVECARKKAREWQRATRARKRLERSGVTR